jgi:hypothetical protein
LITLSLMILLQGMFGEVIVLRDIEYAYYM